MKKALRTAAVVFVLMIACAVMFACGNTSEEFTVTFMIGSEVHQTQTVAENELAAKPADPAIDDDSTFDGWYTTQDFAEGTAWNFDTDKVTGNVTLYGKVAPIMFTVNLRAGEGRFASSNSHNLIIEVQKNKLIIVSESPILSGHALDGWYTTDDYQEGTQWNLSTDKVTHHVALYAKWRELTEDEQVTVTFVTNCDLNVADFIGQKGSPIGSVAVGERYGYTFAGWFRDNNTFAEPWNVLTDTVDTNTLTLYAKWEKVKYTVEFDTAGGTGIDDQQVEYLGTVAKPANPTRGGYTFSGWYADADFTTEWDFDGKQIEANTVIYAKWIEADSEGNIDLPEIDI